MLEFALAGNTAEGQGRRLFYGIEMNRLTSVMFAVTMACVLVATVSATEEGDMIGLRKSDVNNDVLKRATPAADYRYNYGYYNGLYDNYNNPWGNKPGYYNPASYNPASYNPARYNPASYNADFYNPGYYNPAYYNANSFYNRRSYPGYYEGSPYGPYNSGYYSGYYNNTKYPYGNYAGYLGNYPSPYQYYPGYQEYSPYNPAYNDRYYNPGYYQRGLYNSAGAYIKSDAAGKKE